MSYKQRALSLHSYVSSSSLNEVRDPAHASCFVHFALNAQAMKRASASSKNEEQAIIIREGPGAKPQRNKRRRQGDHSGSATADQQICSDDIASESPPQRTPGQIFQTFERHPTVDRDYLKQAASEMQGSVLPHQKWLPIHEEEITQQDRRNIEDIRIICRIPEQIIVQGWDRRCIKHNTIGPFYAGPREEGKEDLPLEEYYTEHDITQARKRTASLMSTSMALQSANPPVSPPRPDIPLWRSHHRGET